MTSKVVADREYRPSTIVDFVLTAMFGLLVAFILICFATTNITDLYIFLGSCVLIYLAIKGTDLFCIYVMRDIVSKKLLAGAPFNHPLSNKKTFVKFVGSMWQLFIHLSMSIAELYIISDETWLEKSWTIYSHPWTIYYEAKTSLRLFFILQMAIWVCTCFSHRFNSDAHMHKDYIPMYVHHIVTIILVSIAYVTRHTRAGFVVLFVHDISDIGIDLLKICNYLRLEGRKGFYMVESAYALALGLWAYYRLYEFPILVWNGASRICSSDPVWTAPDGTTTYGYYLGETFGYDSNIYYFSVIGVGMGVGLLLILLVLHIWWFALLLRILVRLLGPEKPHEIGASEYEGAHEDDETKKLVKDKDTDKTQDAIAATVAVIDSNSSTPVKRTTKSKHA